MKKLICLILNHNHTINKEYNIECTRCGEILTTPSELKQRIRFEMELDELLSEVIKGLK